MRIVVGVDGSPSSARAVEWCAAHSGPMKAQVVAVHSIEIPAYAASGFGYVPLSMPTESERDEVRDTIRREWCRALSKASIPFRVVLADGTPALAIIAVAEQEAADLVVTGRRGLGGFAELLLGSTSHQLALHIDRPLVTVP